MTTLLLATLNEHKSNEIQQILGSRIRCLTLKDFPAAPAVLEDANTFAGNATRKAFTLARWLADQGNSALTTPNDELRVLADDSGLEVEALNGAPGVHSARFAATVKTPMDEKTTPVVNSSDEDNNAKLLRLLKDVPGENRSARFRCVLALTPVLKSVTLNASPVCATDELELLTELFDGVCAGHIGFEPRGTGGFGYDPLFIPDGCSLSFAELGAEVKNTISHRARALAKLSARLPR